MKNRFALTATLALLTGLGAAQAMPLHYQESLLGDLPQDGLLPVLALDVGVNRVDGTISVRGLTPEDAVADLDHFAFTVAAGQQLLGLSVQMQDTLGNMAWGRWTLWQADSAQDQDGTPLEVTLKPFSPGQASVGGTWGTGLYQLRNDNLAWFPDPQQPLAMADYRIELTVREAIPPVPEPATWALAGSGLLMLALRRARRPAGHSGQH
jgi:hypothetical protein